jgi:hypothetical protein
MAEVLIDRAEVLSDWQIFCEDRRTFQSLGHFFRPDGILFKTLSKLSRTAAERFTAWQDPCKALATFKNSGQFFSRSRQSLKLSGTILKPSDTFLKNAPKPSERWPDSFDAGLAFQKMCPLF